MNMRPPRICPTCRRAVPSGVSCACVRRRKVEHDRKRPTARQRGYTSEWQKARVEFLKDHPRCAMCDAPATVVDHITPHKGDLQLFWRRSNWQALCTPHHSSAKQRQERSA